MPCAVGRGDPACARAQPRYRLRERPVRGRRARARARRPRGRAGAARAADSGHRSDRGRDPDDTGLRRRSRSERESRRSAAEALERFAAWAAQAPGPSARGCPRPLPRTDSCGRRDRRSALPREHRARSQKARRRSSAHARISPTASSCAGRSGVSRLESSFGRRSRPSRGWAQRSGRNGRVRNCTQRVRRRAQRDPSTLDQLTPQERRVAQLAAEAAATATSPHSSSSARRPSSTTSTRCS